jgi:hypothetical protein
MPYIDQAFYNGVYKGTPMDPETFEKLESRASDLIDMVTNYRIFEFGLSDQPEFIQTNIKKAVAAQIEFMHLEGGETSIHGGSPSSVSIGGFSYTEGSHASGGTAGVQVLSDMSYRYLFPTGLLYMGVGVRC